MRPTIFFLLLRPQVSPPHLLMRLKHGDCSFSSLTLSLILSRSSWHFPVPDNFISNHSCPLTLLEHDRLSSLNWFTLSIFLTKRCKPFSCQQLCFLCPFKFCFDHLENPNYDSIQLFLSECMWVYTHIHTQIGIFLQILKFSKVCLYSDSPLFHSF